MAPPRAGGGQENCTLGGAAQLHETRIARTVQAAATAIAAGRSRYSSAPVIQACGLSRNPAGV